MRSSIPAMLSLLLAAGCGPDGSKTHDHDHDHGDDEADAGDVQPYEDGMVAQTTGGHYAVALTLSGGATVGTHDVTIALDHHGSPENADSVELDAWMPAHDHGTDPVDVVRAGATGVYEASGLSLFMPGVWELTVRVEEAGHGGDAVFRLQVEDAD
jgi:hypothetical protein